MAMLNNQMVFLYRVYICLYITVCSLYGTVAPFFSGSIQVGKNRRIFGQGEIQAFWHEKETGDWTSNHQ